MNTEILKFLSELGDKDTEKFFENIKNKKCQVSFKIPGNDKIEITQIYATPFVEKFSLLIRDGLDAHGLEATFKVNIGTDLFFFKSKIKLEKKSFIIEGPFKLFKLVRRKNTRYIIPDVWAQSGFIVSAEKKMLNSKIRLVDMSLSGIRIHVLTELPRYEKMQKISLQFKLHKRAVIVVDALIQHVKYGYQGGQLLGVQFVLLTPLVQSKIANICDDLVHDLA